jgi:hypothetical protein
MKIALCISGLLRTYNKNIINLKKYFLSKYNPDIYIHTWSEIDRGVKTNLNKFESKIKEIYNPKKLIIEDPINFNNQNKVGNTSYDINGVFSMYNSIFKSINMVEENYDLIIRFRGDILLKNNWNLLDHYDKVIIPLYGNFSGYNDQIAYGSMNDMKKYSNCFNKIIDYCKNNVEFCPEVLLKHHFFTENLIVARQDIDYDIIWYNGHVHNMKQKEIDFGLIKS